MHEQFVGDGEYTVIKKTRADGDQIASGDVVAEMEGSKALFELESLYEGFIFYFVEDFDQVKVGQCLAAVTRQPNLDKRKALSQVEAESD